MESSSILSLSKLSLFPSKPINPTPKTSPFRRPWTQSTSQSTRLYCHKMFVPGFGEASPEAKAEQSYNPEAHEELMEFVSRNSVNDGDEFCANLMRESSRHQGLALRILEVRSAYCKKDFEWDNLEKLAVKMVEESNTRLMRDYVLETSHVEKEK